MMCRWMSTGAYSRPSLSFVGFKYEQINYTGNEQIAINFANPASPQMSDNRDNRSEYVYVGGQYTPLDNLNLLAKWVFNI